MAQHYEAAGVNLEAGYEVVSRIKSHVKSTNRFGSMGNIGSFGGMFDLSALNIKQPVLVSGTDGVGMFDVGVSKDFLLRERTQAYKGLVTPDCRHKCSGCGANALLREVKCDA